MGALDIQIGGYHYKDCPYQPVKFSTDLNLNFIQGNIVKYITRYKRKNGRQDLEKVIHYIQLGQTLKPVNNVVFSHEVKQKIDYYVSANGLNENERKVVSGAVYQCWSITEHYTTKVIESWVNQK